MSTVPWGVAALSPNPPIYGTAGDEDDNLGTQLVGSDGDDFFLADQGGADDVYGGAGDDSFYFGAQFGLLDEVRGGTGNDMLILQGSYTQVDLQLGVISGIETIVLMSAADTRFGASGAGLSSYAIVADDSTVAAGQQLTIQGNRLGANEAISFLGFGESDGSFRIVGGASNDFFYGGGGADMFIGGLGMDQMNGLGGNDIFVYRSTAESTPVSQDVIYSLAVGDVIDLSLIDADTAQGGDQAFAFIGSDAFHNVAGELRVTGSDSNWTIQADTNGDGVADFSIAGQLGMLMPDASFFLL